MPFSLVPVTLDKSASPFRRALQYAFYDWTRDMPRRRRIVATVGLLIQAAVLSGLLIAIGHHVIAVPLGALFLIGLMLLNGALTSEFERKMQLESDQIAAQQIQQTLQAQNPESLLYAYLTIPRFTAPRWYIEGSAVFMETWMGGGVGRAQGGYDEMVFRAMVRDDAYFYDPLGLVSRGTRVDFQVGANAYL